MTRPSFFNTRFYALKSLLMGILVLAGMLIPFFSFAYEDYLFIDWFNDYDLGVLSGQGGWTGNNWEVQEDKKYEGSKGIYCPNTLTCTGSKSDQQAETGKFVIMVYLTSEGNPKQGIQLEFYQATTKKLEFKVEEVSGEMRVYGNTPSFTQIGTWTKFDSWQPVEVEWVNGSPDQWRYRWEDNEWTDWYTGITWIYLEKANVNGSKVGDPANGFVYADTIDKEIIPVFISGFDPIITAEKPIECEWNQSETWFFDLKGKIEIPTENPNIYTKFLLRLYVRQAMEMGLNFVDIEFLEFPDLGTGETWSWDFPEFEIPADDNGYFLTYWLEGYNAETLKPFRWALMPKDICGKDTILSDKPEFPVGLIPTEWIEMIYEDCTLLTGFEKIMCEFTNWVKSIFAPSKEQLDALNQDLDQIKTKFPFTYISVFTNFVKNVKSGINESKGISFKILGVEGAVDLDFWEEPTSFGGITQSFSTIFRGFVILFISIGFVGGWLIPFIRKIL